ncbi:hypothetical protein ACWEV4_34220 [Streptomyces sp. NPDC003860]
MPQPRGIHRSGPPGQQHLRSEGAVAAQDQMDVDRLAVHPGHQPVSLYAMPAAMASIAACV